jgi:ribosomal protein S15P/S13E
VNIESENSTVIAGERVIATIGLKDMVVVDTQMQLLFRPGKIQDVRKVVEALKRDHREEHLVHRTVERPWEIILYWKRQSV